MFSTTPEIRCYLSEVNGLAGVLTSTRIERSFASLRMTTREERFQRLWGLSLPCQASIKHLLEFGQLLVNPIGGPAILDADPGAVLLWPESQFQRA